MGSGRGFFISFEGGEGCGKSTQARLLAERLRAVGYRVLLTREPGGTVIGDEIRKILQYNRTSHNMTPQCEMLLFSAARAQHVREVIRPALARGEIVISDRFLDSTTAYQAYGRKLDLRLVSKVHEFAVRECVPDLTFLIDLDPRLGLERARGRELFDRMENETLGFYEQVRQGYREIARREPERVVVLDGGQSVEKIQAEVQQHVMRKLHRMRP